MVNRRSQKAQTPCTESINARGSNSHELLEKLIDLTVGEVVQLVLDVSADTEPSYFDPDRGYEVIKTVVDHDDDAQENYFKIYLGSQAVTSMDDPLFKLTVNTSSDGEWEKCWVNIRTGTNKWGNDDYSMLSGDLQDITVVEGVEQCPECGRPT
jgi:hypothetical protein